MDGSVLRAYDMNKFEIQLLHISEENMDKILTDSMSYDSSDNAWEGNNRRIKDIAQPTADNDAVNLAYLNSIGVAKQKTVVDAETNAKTSETNAKLSETNAKASETNAKASETNAKLSETNAKLSETNAKTSETNAKLSETNAKTSETNAKTSETNAKLSETNAKTSETNAKLSETNANTSDTNAKLSETNAKTSETNAKASETNAKASETNAKASETNAKASETNAKASETNAKASETNAKDSEVASANSETNAKVSETNVNILEQNMRALANSVNPSLNIRINSHAYAVGDIAYSASLPSWARLECVTAGTTAATEPTMPTSAGVLLTDGGVKWIIDDIRDATPVGVVIGRLYLPAGYVKANGATVNRADYPRLAALATNKSLWTSDIANYPGLFGNGDGSTTMVLPNYRGMFARYLDESRGMDIDGKSRTVGNYQSDAFKSHNHGGLKYCAWGRVDNDNTNYVNLTTGTGLSDGGTETRSKNIGVLAVLRY